MADGAENYGNRRKGDDRRSATDRRSAKERRSKTDRRSSEDRRRGWGQLKDERLRGALTTAATVAHLFSQPLTIIIGHVDLLMSSTKEEATQKKLKIIKDQLQTLSIILHNLRDLREYRTIDFNGLTLLDIKSREKKITRGSGR